MDGIMKLSEANKVTTHVGRVVNMLIGLEAYRVTAIISPKVVISAVRRGAKKRIDHRDKNVDVVLKIGMPNYAQRRFIKRTKGKEGTDIVMPTSAR